ncbi:response regulator transcription factor, partial [Streptomyces sp. NPDC006658]|uniref:response regulator n=1 Tax=Streptomyces sp. NPDC006658 TaxID=3156900 RepID=UPI0033C9B107
MTQRQDPIKVMVVDDHPMWRDAVARDLSESGFEVVATAGDGEQAVRRARAAAPDVLVLDLNLPAKPGVQVCKELVGHDPALRVLVLSASGEHADVLEAVKSGATGYLLKSASTEELLDAVRRTAVGDPVFTPGLAGLVLGEYRRLAAEPAPAADAGRPG